MRKSGRISGLIAAVSAWLLIFHACAVRTAEPGKPIAEGTVLSATQNEFMAEWPELRKRMQAELAQERETEPILLAGSCPDEEKYAKLTEFQERLEALFRDGGTDEAAIAAVDAEIETLDPDGALRAYDGRLRLAREDYPAYSYFFGAHRQYKDGYDDKRENAAPSIYDSIASTEFPPSMLENVDSTLAITCRVVKKGEKELDYADYLPEEEAKKLSEGGTGTTVDRWFEMEIVDCFWGGKEPGDVIAFAPRRLSAKLEEKMVPGSEWMLFLTEDGPFTAEVRGEEGPTWSGTTQTVFLMKDGRVFSISPWEDVYKVDGMGPKELAETVLELKAKYAKEETFA